MIDIKKEAKKNLIDFKEILDQLNIVFWLDGGTLLGAYRDKDFCPGDEDDIDLGTWFNYSLFVDDIKKLALAKGFELYHQWKYQITFKRNGNKIDLFFHNKKGLAAWHILYKRIHFNNMNFKYVETINSNYWGLIPAIVPAHFFEELKQIEFFGKWFNRPRHIYKYFELKYGPKWQTPITREEYFKQGGCYDPEVNKVLKPDYEI